MRDVQTSEDIIKSFHVFDKDGNGLIAASELRNILTNMGDKLSDDQVLILSMFFLVGTPNLCNVRNVLGESNDVRSSFVRRRKPRLQAVCRHDDEAIKRFSCTFSCRRSVPQILRRNLPLHEDDGMIWCCYLLKYSRREVSFSWPNASWVSH